VADIEARGPDAVAVTLAPVTGDGIGICAQPEDTANAKKNNFLIMFMIITLTTRNLFYILYYLTYVKPASRTFRRRYIGTSKSNLPC
jgi:hypothetical protein